MRLAGDESFIVQGYLFSPPLPAAEFEAKFKA
jgi:EAL domain-containing protein (putative c-di-GMP-specific phosphodiesterase class I)